MISIAPNIILTIITGEPNNILAAGIVLILCTAILLACIKIYLLHTHKKSLMLKITELTDNLNNARKKFYKANRAKHDFLSRVGHELRTPLNGILGYVQILERETSQSKSRKKGLNIIHNCSNHLLDLINDILDLSKIEVGKIDLEYNDFDLISLIEDLSEMIEVKIREKGLMFKKEVMIASPVYVRFDYKKIYRVLLNLLSNAIQFTQQGEITFTIKPGSSSTTGSGMTILFEVSDTGIGIPEDQLEKIFFAFEQIKATPSPSGKGPGLGLTISSKLVDLMGGKLQVKSIEGKGSTFHFEIEMEKIQKLISASTLEINKITGYTGQRYKILVVDDNDVNRQVIMDILQSLDFTVLTAINGRDGFNKAKSFVPDLILTDKVMPDIDGFGLLNLVHNDPDLKNIHVVMISASASTLSKKECFDKGCADFIKKPVTMTELLTIIGRLLDIEWIYRNEEQKKNEQQTSTIQYPPEIELKKLLELAEIYDYDGIKTELTQLQEQNTNYSGFAHEIIMLLKTYKMPEIITLIHNNLT